MLKKEYYEISEAKKLPLRCPCLSNCLRYRFTAYYVGQTCYETRSSTIEEKLKEMRIIGQEESISKMLDAGEPVTFIGGSSSFYITNGCPEFFLHDHEHKLSGMQKIGTHQFSYDEYFQGSKFIPGESRHYTECAEYSLFTSRSKKASSRKKISPKIKAELQKEINSTCQFCSSQEVGHFQIHHIDENKDNNERINLLLVCANCHSKITKGDIPKEDVIECKRQLLK